MNVLIDSQWLGFVVDVSYFFPMLHLPHIKILELFCSFPKCITRNMNRIILKYSKWKRKKSNTFSLMEKNAENGFYDVCFVAKLYMNYEWLLMNNKLNWMRPTSQFIVLMQCDKGNQFYKEHILQRFQLFDSVSSWIWKMINLLFMLEGTEFTVRWKLSSKIYRREGWNSRDHSTIQ